MRRTPRTRFAVATAAALATFTFAATACGGDDDDTDATDAPVESDAAEDTVATVVDPTVGADPSTGGSSTGEVGTKDDYVQAIKTAIEDDLADPSQADCFAESLVSDDVYAGIQEAGLTPEQFGEGPSSLTIDQAQAEAIADDLADCGELADLFGGGDAETSCVSESLDNDQLALVITLSAFELPLTDDLQTAQDDITACIQATTTTG